MTNCVMTRLGECSYEETGCSDCRIISKCREALDKQVPKKPIYTNKGTVTRCPNCGAIHFQCLPTVGIDYCARCGQAIDWSVVE